MKNPKARGAKKPAQASRTVTRQSAMQDINRGLDNLNLLTSNLPAHEIPAMDLNLGESEIFELPDSELVASDHADSKDIACDTRKKDQSDLSPTKGLSQQPSRLTLPPKPFTIISGFRK